MIGRQCSGRSVTRRVGVVVIAVLASWTLALPSASSAATTIGQTFVPGLSGSCNGGPDWEVLQTSRASGVSYAVPSDGVLTSWSFHAGADPTTLTMRVFRPTGTPNQYTVIADASELKAIAAGSGPHTFPTQIPVRAGDIIGIRSTTGTCASQTANPGDSSVYHIGTATPVGATNTYNTHSGFIWDISAQLEPDCDGDGFGDETQDGDLSACQPGDGLAPTAAITKGPKNKTKKKRATFEFAGTDARAIASFQCSLDGAVFTPCTSPHTVKVKKGKHTFQVRALDEAGNVGAPASDTWKRKKKQ